MKALLLGGTGAMGVPLANILEKQGFEVYITSRQERNGTGNIYYIKGDAHNSFFLKKILNDKFDVIVDFMIWPFHKFKDVIFSMLKSSEHYIFISSGRVFADSDCPIVETSPRLLDVCNDRAYLRTNEYALCKAREEDFLRDSGRSNWTIVRPYITYNSHRLQLGTFEKEQWLHRVLNSKAIVFPKEMLQKYTTMTYARDVARVIAKLSLNKSAMSEAVNITADAIKWKDIIQVYSDVLEQKAGLKIDIRYVNASETIIANKYQVLYDRMFNRIFDNTKALAFNSDSNFKFVDVYVGLKECLEQFLDAGAQFKKLNYYSEALMDSCTGENILQSEYDGIFDVCKYNAWKFAPQALRCLADVKNQWGFR